jgi:aminoglycoside phosphotransferase (APT) family kinase protein
MAREPDSATALDPDAALSVLSGPVEAWAGFRPRSCRVRELKRTERRLVARYDLGDGIRSAAVVGKWYSTDRGAIVADALGFLRANGFSGPEVAVPEPIAYVDRLRVLFTEVVEGPLLRELLREDEETCVRAGEWLATFHGTALPSPRSCGPAKQRRAVERWSAEAPPLHERAGTLDAALADLPDPRLPVHYDYYHSQLLAADTGATVALDLDEAGLGDPAFDLAHFSAHLELLALQWTGDPRHFDGADGAFERGYASVAPLPEARAALAGFAWFKLAHQLVRRRAPAEHLDYAFERLGAILSAA